MSSDLNRQKILAFLSEYNDLLKQLLGDPDILRGSFHQVHTRCGKINCWCSTSAKGHAHTRLTWSEDGALMTRKVPAAETEKVAQLTRNYRSFKKQRRRLVVFQRQLEDQLNRYERVRIQEVRKPLVFLAVRSRLPGKKKQALHREPMRENGHTSKS